MASMTRVSDCGNAVSGDGTRDGGQATPAPAPGNLAPATEDPEVTEVPSAPWGIDRPLGRLARFS